MALMSDANTCAPFYAWVFLDRYEEILSVKNAARKPKRQATVAWGIDTSQGERGMFCYLAGSEWVDELELVLASFRWLNHHKIDQCTNLLWTSQAADIQKRIHVSLSSAVAHILGSKRLLCLVAIRVLSWSCACFLRQMQKIKRFGPNHTPATQFCEAHTVSHNHGRMFVRSRLLAKPPLGGDVFDIISTREDRWVLQDTQLNIHDRTQQGGARTSPPVSCSIACIPGSNRFHRARIQV